MSKFSLKALVGIFMDFSEPFHLYSEKNEGNFKIPRFFFITQFLADIFLANYLLELNMPSAVDLS